MSEDAPLRRRARFTLTDLLLVLGVVLLLGTYLWPIHRVDGLVAAEDRIADWVAAAGASLEEARSAATLDADGDGRGEYPPLTALGLPDLESAGEGRFRVHGYHVALLRPNRRLQAALETAGERTALQIDAAEAGCVLMAWPERRGETGLRAFAWSPADGLLKHTVDGYPYDANPPPFRGAIVERVAGELMPSAYVGEFWRTPPKSR